MTLLSSDPLTVAEAADVGGQVSLEMIPEPWLDKRKLADHLSCSVRSLELAIVEGMPHAIIFGRVKFHASEVEAWLMETGRLERRGDLDTLIAELVDRRRAA